MLLNLYFAQGEGMLGRLNRIFAFALWDSCNQSLFIARDALGVKPLYYSASSRGVAFASEIKELLPHILEARELDLQGLHRYLYFLWCPGEGAPLNGVRKLLPGQGTVVQDGRIERRWIWYSLPVFRGISASLNEQDAIDGTVERVRQAVHR